MHVLHVVGARPNFMKAASLLRALGQANVRQTLVHTGQHYDVNMSEVFFRQLGIPEPDVNLAVGSGSHALQTARVMACFEPIVAEYRPHLVLVYGDINSTAAAALVCAKLSVPVGHVEAGLRSFDRSMPEEINRVVTDQLSELLFTPSADANANLLREGIAERRMHFVGNVMIDTLVRLLPRALEIENHELPPKYGLLTLHRPANVDEPETLHQILTSILAVSQQLPIIFPVHPRTRQSISQFDLSAKGIQFCGPLSYVEFLALQRNAMVVLTDSGGVQEETTYLGVPCLTLRHNTERPITVEMGTNILVGRDPERLCIEFQNILNGRPKRGQVPPLWDGHAGERIAALLSRA